MSFFKLAFLLILSGVAVSAVASQIENNTAEIAKNTSAIAKNKEDIKKTETSSADNKRGIENSNIPPFPEDKINSLALRLCPGSDEPQWEECESNPGEDGDDTTSNNLPAHCKDMSKVRSEDRTPETAKTLSKLQNTDCALEYKVGDIGPVGGVVIHVTDEGKHGIEASTNPTALGSWGCFKVYVLGADSVIIGGGLGNFNRMIRFECDGTDPRTGHDNIAQYVTIFMKNNFEDWYLPNVDEMITLVDTFNKKGIQIPRKHYWTSSQNDTENASAIYVDNASEIVRRETRKKTHDFPAIPVRNF